MLNFDNDTNINNCTSEYRKRLENEKRKHLRLEQVRLQSKEIAQNLRTNVKCERENQLRKIEQIKSREFNQWRKSCLSKVNQEYRACLSKVGEANIAATEEEKLIPAIQQRIVTNTEVAQKRGKIAAKKLRNSKTNNKIKSKSVSTQVEILHDLDISSDSSTASDKRTHIYLPNQPHPSTILTTTSNFSPSKYGTKFHHDENYDQRKIQTFPDNTEEYTLRNNKNIYDNLVTERGLPLKIDEKREMLDNISESDTLTPRFPFSQISDIFKRRKIILNEVPKSKVQFNDQQHDPLIPDQENIVENIPEKPATTQSSDKNILDSKEAQNKNLINHTKDRPQSSTSKSTDKLTGSSSRRTEQTTSSVASKQSIPFYDNWTKFSKEYVPRDNIVIKEDANSDLPNAMELAKRELEAEELRFKRLEEMQRNEAIRSERAIDRLKIQKDYDSLNERLEDLTRKERYLKSQMVTERVSDNSIKQLTEDLQTRINASFEKVLKKNDIQTHSKPDSNYRIDDQITQLDVANEIPITQLQNNISTSDSSVVNEAKSQHRKPVVDQFNKETVKTPENELKSGMNELIEKIIQERDNILKYMNKAPYEEVKKQTKSIQTQYIPEKDTLKPSRTDKVVQTENDKYSKVISQTPVGIDIPLNIIVTIRNEQKDDPQPIIIQRKLSVDHNNQRYLAIPTTSSNIPLAIDTTSSSTVYKSLPPVLHTSFGRMLDQRTSSVDNIQLKTNKNTDLGYYISKLLQMSRQSIDNLPVSSVSEISTPSQTIVNNSSNVLNDNFNNIDRINQFINDNYSFADEIDNSLKENTVIDLSKFESFIKNRTKEEKQMRKDLKKGCEIKEIQQSKGKTKKRHKMDKLKPEKPYIDISPIPKSTSISTEDNSTNNGSSSIDKAIITSHQISPDINQNLAEKYNSLTEHCSKRINELSEMISKMREEKKRIIEGFSPSSSETARNSTEYLDLPSVLSGDLNKFNHCKQETQNFQKITEAKKLAASVDSGICVSRPLTSSDVHDISEQRPISSEPNTDNLYKDLLVRQTIENIQKDGNVRHTKPPTSIARYSPKLNDMGQHELSTIIEIDTPATSKLNFNENELDKNAQIPEKQSFNLDYQKFQSRKEYNEAHGISNVSSIQNNTDVEEKIVSPHSDESLPDVVAELKRRNVLQHSFDNSSESVDNSSDLDEILLNKLNPEYEKDCKKSSSVPKNKVKSIESNLLAKLPESQSNINTQTTKQTNDNLNEKYFELSEFQTLSSDSSSKPIETLENDLNEMGLGWASNMLKKTKTAQLENQSSSTSSSLNNETHFKTLKNLSVKTERFFDSTLVSEDDSSFIQHGKPMGLKEFLDRELRKRVNSNTSSVRSTDGSSLGSIFLKSLLTSSQSARELEKNQRTSTPKNISTNSIIKVSDKSSGLFSGESNLSSVKMGSNNSNQSDNSNPYNNGKFLEPLEIPSAKLDVKKIRKKDSSTE